MNKIPALVISPYVHVIDLNIPGKYRTSFTRGKGGQFYRVGSENPHSPAQLQHFIDRGWATPVTSPDMAGPELRYIPEEVA